jgi:hypothetical protein
VLFGEYFKSFPFSVILGRIREKPPRIAVDLDRLAAKLKELDVDPDAI